MCGIVALITSRSLPERILAEMRDRLTHRGPDAGRSWRTQTPRGTVALAHRRLSIIDLSRDADQPMLTADGTLAVVYNGEIYNYVELRQELQRLGKTFRTKCDTEVLLAAYEQWGHECLQHLNGMFAFALWDARRQEMFVARDRFGEKPLFFTRLPDGGIAFASEMKALFAHPEVVARASPAAIDDYVAGRFYEDTPKTFFLNVDRLLQAHAMVVGNDGRIRRHWRYWTPDYTSMRDDYREAEAIAEFEARLRRSVQMRLRSDVAVGTSLSGGLDSSMIVCLLADERQRAQSFSQNAFSGRFDDVDPTLSEGSQIDLVVQRTGVRAHGVVPRPDGLASESECVHWHQEEPFLSASIYMQWCVMRLAREHDTTVLLDGQGADELLAGYQFYFASYQLDLLDRGRFATLLKDTFAFRKRLYDASRLYANSQRRFNRDSALGLRTLLGSLRASSSVYHGPYEVGVPPPIPGLRLRRQIAEALQYNSLPQLLRYADRNAMAFSRETRFPYLDHDLVDWVIALPDAAYIKDGWQKYILRRAGEGSLPRAVQWRADKVGYAAPLDLWLRDELRGWGHERLFSGAITDVPGYDRAELQEMWRRHQNGENLSWPLWRWISLNEWFGLLESGAWRRGFNAGVGAPASRAVVG